MVKRLADDVPAFKNIFFLSKTSKRAQSITGLNSLGNVKYL